MEWYNILVLVIGAVGGTTGIVALYKAKAEKKSIDIDNLIRIIDQERQERKELKLEFEEYKKAVDERIRLFKEEFAIVKRARDSLEDAKRELLNVIHEARICPFLDKLDNCPVMKAYEECEQCQQDK